MARHRVGPNGFSRVVCRDPQYGHGTALVRSVTARSHSRAGRHELPEAHSLTRWAAVVLRAIDSQTDARTLHEWGRSVGASTGALRNWCRTAGLSARRSLQFARMLRAVVRQAEHHTPMPPEHLLNIVDRRTLVKLLRASGGTQDRLPPSVNDFLERQQLIESPEAVAEIRIGLAALVRHVSLGPSVNAHGRHAAVDDASVRAPEAARARP